LTGNPHSTFQVIQASGVMEVHYQSDISSRKLISLGKLTAKITKGYSKIAK